MGVGADACAADEASRPTVAQMASILERRNPLTDDPDASDLPPLNGRTASPWAATPDTDNRIEFRDHTAAPYWAIFGYIGSTDDAPSENADAGFRCDGATKLLSAPHGCAQTTGA